MTGASRPSPRIVALVPMRHGSERVRGKNHRVFAGRPLYHHVVGALLDCPRISEVVIDTDSPDIQEDAARVFPSVRLLERPQHLRGGHVSMNDVIVNAVGQLDADLYLQTHSTNPLLSAASIEAMITRFLAARGTHDSLFSVTRHQKRLWTADCTPLNHDPSLLRRTQDLQPVYEENSCVYLFSRRLILEKHNRIGEQPLLFELDPVEAWDIDEEYEFIVAERLYEWLAHGRSR